MEPTLADSRTLRGVSKSHHKAHCALLSTAPQGCHPRALPSLTSGCQAASPAAALSPPLSAHHHTCLLPGKRALALAQACPICSSLLEVKGIQVEPLSLDTAVNAFKAPDWGGKQRISNWKGCVQDAR